MDEVLAISKCKVHRLSSLLVLGFCLAGWPLPAQEVCRVSVKADVEVDGPESDAGRSFAVRYVRRDFELGCSRANRCRPFCRQRPRVEGRVCPLCCRATGEGTNV